MGGALSEPIPGGMSPRDVGLTGVCEADIHLDEEVT